MHPPSRPPLEGDVAHDEGVYALFVDLRKAFDSAPRETTWRIWSSLGVPPGLVALVAELHNGMGACVKYHGTLNDRFSMRTGVRQGAVEADGDLNRRRMRIKTQASRHINVADVEYADDMMGLLLSFEELQIAAQLLSDTVRDWGGELNVKKTKWMCIRSALAGLGRVAHVRVNNEEVEQVDEFRYLGSVVASEADLG